MKLGYQNQATDQVNKLMAEIKSTNFKRERDIVDNIIERNIIKENLDSSNEEAINGDKITSSRITFKRRRLKQSNLNKSDKLIKRDENENDNINKSKQEQHYIYQFSPFLPFSHQSNGVKICPSCNQPISDSGVVASCCCCYLDNCFHECATNMETFRSPTEPVLSLQNEEEKEEETCTEERSREANKRLIRGKQDNLKFMFKREPKCTSSSVFILFSIISLLFSKQNTQHCDIGHCKSKFIMEAVGKC